MKIINNNELKIMKSILKLRGTLEDSNILKCLQSCSNICNVCHTKYEHIDFFIRDNYLYANARCECKKFELKEHKLMHNPEVVMQILENVGEK